MLTPNNRERLFLSSPTTIDDCWIAASDYPNTLQLSTDPTYGSFVNKFIIQACGQINRMTNRFWNYQTADDVFLFRPKNILDYETYFLNNTPVTEIVDVYLQVNEYFSVVDVTQLQLFGEEHMVRFYPLNLSIVGIDIVEDRLTQLSTHMWVRYKSGYAKANIPEEIKQATAMYVSYIVNGFKDTSMVKSFSTQTYSQTNASPSENPVLLQIKEMLKPFTLVTIA